MTTANPTSNYFYGDEATQFTYFRIPCQLITHPRFKHLSTGSKLLYGMHLDRMSLSLKNEWHDTDGRVYIYYTVDEICSNLTCGRDNGMKLLAELDTGKRIGLIERIKNCSCASPIIFLTNIDKSLITIFRQNLDSGFFLLEFL